MKIVVSAVSSFLLFMVFNSCMDNTNLNSPTVIPLCIPKIQVEQNTDIIYFGDVASLLIMNDSLNLDSINISTNNGKINRSSFVFNKSFSIYPQAEGDLQLTITYPRLPIKNKAFSVKKVANPQLFLFGKYSSGAISEKVLNTEISKHNSYTFLQWKSRGDVGEIDPVQIRGVSMTIIYKSGKKETVPGTSDRIFLDKMKKLISGDILIFHEMRIQCKPVDGITRFIDDVAFFIED